MGALGLWCGCSLASGRYCLDPGGWAGWSSCRGPPLQMGAQGDVRIRRPSAPQSPGCPRASEAFLGLPHRLEGRAGVRAQPLA